MLRPRCPPADDPEIGSLLGAIASATRSRWVRLELRPDEVLVGREYIHGSLNDNGARCTLRLPARFEGTLECDGSPELIETTRQLAELAVGRMLVARRLHEEAAILKGALDTTSSAVLLFDARGAIIYANSRGDTLLARQTEAGLRVESSQHPTSPLVTHVCYAVESVSGAPDGPSSWRGTLPLSDGSVMACEVLRVDIAGEATGVLAILQPVTPMPQRWIESFCQTHGLSPREEETMRLLIEGLTTSAIADQLSISRHTVRDHLKHLYRKTGTRSRGELVSLVAGSAPSAHAM